MISKRIELKDGQTLVIREPEKEDAAGVLEYVDKMAAETDYLLFSLRLCELLDFKRNPQTLGRY